MRHLRLAVAVVLAAALCLSAAPAFAARPAPPPAPTPGPWRQLMGNAQHNGLSPYIGPSTANIKWEYGAKTDLGRADNTQPVLAGDGTAYIQTSTGLYAFTSRGAVKWFLADTADRKFLTDGTPALAADGTVYAAASGTAGNFVVAISPAGAELWRTAVPTGYSSLAYVTVSPTGTIYHGSNVGITAITSAGTVLWNTNEGINGIALSPDGSAGYAVDPSTGAIVKIDLVTGGAIWHFQTPYLPSSGWSMITVGMDGSVYVPETNSVKAIDSNGIQKWVWNADGAVTCLVAESIVGQAPDGSLRVPIESMATGTENRGRLLSIDSATGATNWIFDCDTGTGASGGCVTVDAAGKSYFTASYNAAPSITYVYCVDANGQKVWSWRPYNDCYWFSHAIAADGTAYYFNGWDRRIYAFGAR